MILLCGIPSETPLRMVANALQARGADFRLFNQREVGQYRLSFEVSDGVPTGELTMKSERIALEDVGAAYYRLMDDRLLPELDNLPEEVPERRHSRALHDCLYRWLEVAPGRHVNRSDPQGSNGSKPYQAQLIRQYGLNVPETLVTNDPARALEFRREHGTVIYKSMSGVRSIVQALSDDDVERLDLIRWCPVQFQALVPGVDIRVHVIGDDAFATKIVSDRIDYRYAKKNGGETRLESTTLDAETIEKCIALTRGLGLSFAGIDLKRTPAGEFYCFEVNPCPAFSYYEANTGQPIAAAVASFLCGSGSRLDATPPRPARRRQAAGRPAN